MSEIIIGIDLGTTNSLAATVNNGTAEIIESTKTPSILYLSKEKKMLGNEALSQIKLYPEHTFYSFKRFMGRSYSEIEKNLEKAPYQIRSGERGSIILKGKGIDISPEEASAEILSHIKKQAEDFLKQEIKKAIITVPAYFDDTQRQSTKNAAQIAGLHVERIINEPTAAAIAYGLDEKKKGNIVVYDFGGGTFDVSVLSLKGKLFKVLSTNGDTQLGGDDIDNIIIDKVTDLITKNGGEVNKNSASHKGYLKTISENIKINLSTNLEFTLEVELPNSAKKINITITQKELNTWIFPVIQKTLHFVQEAISDAKLTIEDIEDIILVGGSTRIPLVRQLVEEYFQKPPHIKINPEEVVALGASIQAHLLQGGRRDFVLLDVIPLSLGLETIGGTFSKLIMKNASVPAKATETFSTSVDNQTGVEISIYQGEREFVSDCRKLGKFILKGIPAMPAGLPRVEVTFLVDVNGLLKVSAKELRSGVVTKIDLIPQHGLHKNEVRQIIKDSYEYALEDFKDRNLSDFREKAKAIFKGLDKIWDKTDGLLTEKQKNDILQQRSNVETAMTGNDPDILKSEIDKLGDLTRDFSDNYLSSVIKDSLQEVSS